MGWINDNSGSLIGAASSIGSSVIGAISANKQLQQQFENQKALYNQQFEQQKQLINEQNEYNSYANQRKLMEEAGLNPALMYQNGTSGALQSEVANPQVPQAPLMQGAGSIAASGIDKGIQTMMSLAQLKLLQAQAKKVDAETEGQNILNKYTPQQFEMQLSKGIVDIAYTKALTEKSVVDMQEGWSRVELNKAQVDSLLQGVKESKFRSAKIFLELDGVVANNDLIRQKVATEILQQSLVSFQEALMVAETNEANARTANINSETFLNNWRKAFIQDTGIDPNADQWQSIVQLAKKFGLLSFDEVNIPNKVSNFVNKRYKERLGELQESLMD